MSIHLRHVGDSELVTGTFTDSSGTAVDPTTVTLKVLDPSGNLDTFTYAASPSEITRASLGVFTKSIELDEAGEWRYEWISTGSGADAQPGQIVVEPLPL